MPVFIFPPIPLIRRNVIIKKLTEHGAVSPETAVTFREAGIISPDGFAIVTRKLVKQGILAKTDENKYYLAK